MKTFNRGKLKRLIEKGYIICVNSYFYDEMDGLKISNKERPVRIQRNYDDWQEGAINLTERDLRTQTGRAWEETSGDIILKVHGNEKYTFRIKA
tara:strand:- start:6457 stop:6738 length:282 start_codon:yes stop_codon:yes gene_type:complete